MSAANPARPAVSVIVPARNEEDCLGACLESLVSQTGVDFELIVVDDASTDRTREIAGSFPKVTLVEAGPLPEGWTGKNNAMTSGARAAHGEWLLFTDADTVHLPGSLAHALSEAKSAHAALFSYSPEQVVNSFWERAVMPVIFAELAVTFRPADVSNPNSPVAAANGQYLLISRGAYDGIGTHAAVAGSILEDVSLARKVKASGRKIILRYGGGAVRTRMYRSFGQLIEGWTKNLALLFPSPGRLAALRLVEFLLISGSAATVAFETAVHRPRTALIAGAVFLVFYSLFVARIIRGRFSVLSDVLAVLGLPMFAWLLLRSRAAHHKGAVSWKGRSYDAKGPKPGIHRPAGVPVRPATAARR